MATPAHPGHVLLVDPDKVEREDLAQLLARSGFAVAAAANGHEALEIAHEALPVLVVLEVALGDLSGYEVCRSLRAEFGSELPIVFLSGLVRNHTTAWLGFSSGQMTTSSSHTRRMSCSREFADSSSVRSPLLTAHTSLRSARWRCCSQLAEGLTQDEIGERLFISPKTVGTHIEHILAKLGVRRRAQAIALAYKQRLI